MVETTGVSRRNRVYAGLKLTKRQPGIEVPQDKGQVIPD